ncbi:alpha/beta hydrolase fold domain-containing protein [Nakamurella sp. GG22]
MAVRGIFRVLPAGVRKVLAGRPIRRDGLTLDPDLQLLLRLERLTTAGTPAVTLQRRREHLDVAGALAGGPVAPGMTSRELAVPSTDPGRQLDARLYTPDGLPPGSGLLVFLHGGGWVNGSLISHDPLCRFLAAQAGVRVLSVAYRLAPEHPFPAAIDDVTAAFAFAHEHAAELGADPAAIAMGGDSAGGNLAAVVTHLAVRAGRPAPAFLLLFYPACDAAHRSPSRHLFAKGFFLTEADVDWFCDKYLPAGVDRSDPRASILLAPDLSGMPAGYLVTAGFDPLRDEGEMFAHRLREAGARMTLRREPDLIHGFASMIGISGRSREAVAQAAGALRVGLTLTAREPAPQP